jgi:hypothetical protein
MSLRVALALTSALSLLACVPAPDRPEPKQDAEPKPDAEPTPARSDPQDYSRFGMPDPQAPWSIGEYSGAGKAVSAIAKEDPALLPREGSPAFLAIADLDHLRELLDLVKPEQLASLALSLGAIHAVYREQAKRDPAFERERVVLGAAMIAVTSRLPGAVVQTPEDIEALRGVPARLQSTLNVRHGLHEFVAAMLATPPDAHGCEQLARVIEDAAPFLLPDERIRLREQASQCTAAGAQAETIAQLERSLAADAPTHLVVTELLAEHREYAQRSRP